MEQFFKKSLFFYLLFVLFLGFQASCVKRSAGVDPGSQALVAGSLKPIKARFENSEGKFHEVTVNAHFAQDLPREYGVIRGRVAHRALEATLSKLKNHLMTQSQARDENAFQPPPSLVQEFLANLEQYIEAKHYHCRGQVILGTPTFRIVNQYLNRTGGNVHIDSDNVPRDFFKDQQIFTGRPPQPLPFKVQNMLEEDRANGGNPALKLNGQYYNIWFNLFNRDDEQSGLIFGLPPQLAELKDKEKFRPFEFRGVRTLKVLASPIWEQMTWLKPSQMDSLDYLIFPTRNSPHAAIDPLVSTYGVHRASVEVRFVALPY